MAELLEILELEEIDADRYRSAAIPTELTRTYGGQVASQSLMAAGRTVGQRYRVHSMHAYFVRPGRPDQPADHVVHRIRDGGSFRTRQVTTVQSGETIFTMIASFHDGDEGFSHQVGMPDVPNPADIAESDPVSGRGNRQLREWSDWDMRWVPWRQISSVTGSSVAQRVWIRYRRTLSDDPLLHACALTYLSDMGLLGSARLPHPDRPVQGASLDHALWFLRPFRADEWMLYDQVSPSANSGRALTEGRLFDPQGRLVATAAQEGLLRFDRYHPHLSGRTNRGLSNEHAPSQVLAD